MNSEQTETAWIVARADPRNPGHTLGRFLGFSGTTGLNCFGKFCWFDTVTHALRFSRRQDAEKFIGAMLGMSQGVLLRDTIAGLRDDEPRPLCVEHSWSSTGGGDGR